jgi:hypothetical protein
MSHDPEHDYTYSAPGALEKRLAELDYLAAHAESELVRKTAEGLAALHRKVMQAAQANAPIYH